MIKRFVWGSPFLTEAIPVENEKLIGENFRMYFGENSYDDFQNILPEFVSVFDNGICFKIENNTRIYGLGETLGGVNKRGRIYRSFCSDDPNHYEDKVSLYAAHNFLEFSTDKTYGVFIDYPGAVSFDVGFSEADMIKVDFEKSLGEVSFSLIIIESEKSKDYLSITREFRKLIGKSYTPPAWAFGYGQSRWGYKDEADIKDVAKGYRDNKIPLSMIYLDIDYMEDFKDFTISDERFPNFDVFVQEMRAQGIQLVPIIDAAIKVQDGFEVYEEGKEKGYFCKDQDGNDFIAAVWPGKSVLPDFLNSSARKWFGDKYKFLIDKGIRGFWNDMNEPAIFYSEKNLAKTFDKIDEYKDKNIGIYDYFSLMGTLNGVSNSDVDYKAFYHEVDGQVAAKDTYVEGISGESYNEYLAESCKKVRHFDVHNLYGYNMTRAAAESFESNYPKEEFLLFSRSSYIGAHRYGGVWQGDNKSIWSHLKMNFQMMPGLNMCGFLYTGADIGGFGANSYDELMLRWLFVGAFTPLFRNHAALGTKNQELYNMTMIPEMRFFINMRYRLLPFIYNEYCKAVSEDDLLFKPMEFVFPDDEIACEIEDQLIYGDKLMLAPVLDANKGGRAVYFPTKMKEIRFKKSTENQEAFFMDFDFKPVSEDEMKGLIDVKKFSLNEEMLYFIRDENISISVKEVDKGFSYVEMPVDEFVVFWSEV